MGMLGDSTDEEFGYSVLSLGSGSTNGCYLLLFFAEIIEILCCIDSVTRSNTLCFFMPNLVAHSSNLCLHCISSVAVFD